MHLLEQLFETELFEEFNRVSKQKKYNAGDSIMQPGQSIEYIPIVMDGVIQVLRESENGESVSLYFLESADTCSVTLQCCMGKKSSGILAIAETDTTVSFVPAHCMEEWLIRFHSWRSYVLNAYNNRVEELLGALDSLAFKQLDIRLLSLLKDKAILNNSTEVKITHQELANQLNTNRVVISRLLKKLELAEQLKISRNAITIFDI